MFLFCFVFIELISCRCSNFVFTLKKSRSIQTWTFFSTTPEATPSLSLLFPPVPACLPLLVASCMEIIVEIWNCPALLFTKLSFFLSHMDVPDCVHVILHGSFEIRFLKGEAPIDNQQRQTKEQYTTNTYDT